MLRNKKIIIAGFLVIVVLIFSFLMLGRGEKKESPSPSANNQKEISQAIPNPSANEEESVTFKEENLPSPLFEEGSLILFYGDICPHCAEVEEFIEEHKIRERLNLIEKEVYRNSENAKELLEKAKACNIPSNAVGVPFLWDGKRCLVGSLEIINFLKERINQR